MRLRRYRPVATLLIGLHLASCTHWVRTSLSPERLLEADRPSTVRITRSDRTRVEVEEPVIRADSLTTGASCSRIAGSYRPACVRVALDDIEGMEVRRFDALGTVVAIVLVPALLFGTLLLSCAGEDSCIAAN